jgi:cysteine synthase
MERFNDVVPIGNTPLVRIKSLSDALGVEILGKAEVCPHVELRYFKSLTILEIVHESWRKCQGSRGVEKCSGHSIHYSNHLLIRLWIVIEDAERQGLLYPHTGSRIFEGTVGSTGISIATIARARSVPSSSTALTRIVHDITLRRTEATTQVWYSISHNYCELT